MFPGDRLNCEIGSYGKIMIFRVYASDYRHRGLGWSSIQGLLSLAQTGWCPEPEAATKENHRHLNSYVRLVIHTQLCLFLTFTFLYHSPHVSFQTALWLRESHICDFLKAVSEQWGSLGCPPAYPSLNIWATLPVTNCSLLVISQQQMRGSVTCDALSLSQILLLFSISLGHSGWVLPPMCFSHSLLSDPFRLMLCASAQELKWRLDGVMSQEFRSLTKQHEARVVRETFCPSHTQLCALCVSVCLFF